jgi:hypothetical protein
MPFSCSHKQSIKLFEECTAGPHLAGDPFPHGTLNLLPDCGLMKTPEKFVRTRAEVESVESKFVGAPKVIRQWD